MKTVELFAGIGGFRIAADRLGFKTVWSNDICSSACKVYSDRFGNTELIRGDISTLIDEVPKHDLLTGGFPCQPFSSAGKKRGIEDPRGTLFNNIVKILTLKKPKFFVLENVKRLLTMDRGTHFATILASLADLNYRIEWRLLNALDFGLAQNRQRVVIVGVKTSESSKHPFLEDNKVRTVLATEIDLLQSKAFACSGFPRSLTWARIVEHGAKFPKWGVAWQGKFCGANLEIFSDAKAHTMLKSVLERKVDRKFDFTESTLERIEKSESVNRYYDGVEILCNQSGGARMGYTVFGSNGVAPTLTATASRHYERYKIDNRYRRLTNVEYARLQGFPDDHCKAISLYSQYRLFGNAVPPPMVEWVLRRLESSSFPVNKLPESFRQKELFTNV